MAKLIIEIELKNMSTQALQVMKGAIETAVHAQFTQMGIPKEAIKIRIE